jgi:hypothetical protein
MLLTFVMLLSLPSVAQHRFALVIGNNTGQGSDVALQHAQRDAAKVGDTLQRVGDFAAGDVVVVHGEGTDVVRRALISINNRIRQAGGPSLLLVYYSGHADAEALHLGDDRFDVGELEELVRGSAASFRVLVLDACRSGVATQVKGGKPAPLFFQPPMEGPEAAGFVVLTAAAAGEDAQESDELRGSFFTHHFVSGLSGAADRDGNDEVTLEEAYHHAFHETVRASSATLAGTQHPTFRYDVRGKGDIVLARLASARSRAAAVLLPAGVDALLFSDDGDVAAEVKSTNTARRVVVAPGRYQVRARGRDVMYEGDIELSIGASQTVELSSLTTIEYARLVRKGEADRAFVLAPRLGAFGHTAWQAGGGVCNGAMTAVPMEFQYLSVAPRLSLCGAQWENPFLQATELETTLDVAMAHVFDLPVVSLSVGGFAGVTVMQQTFKTTGRAPSRTSTWPTFGMVGEAVVPLWWGLYVAGGVEARSAAMIIERQQWATPLACAWHASLGWTL